MEPVAWKRPALVLLLASAAALGGLVAGPMAVLQLSPDSADHYFDALGDLLLALWTGILAGWVAYYLVGVAGLRRTLPAGWRRRAGMAGLLAAPVILWARLWAFTLLYTSGLQPIALAGLPVVLAIPV